MSRDLNITDFLVGSRIDYPDFAKILTRILSAISHVEVLRVSITHNTVRTQIEVDGIQQSKGVTPKNPEHPIISTCNKELVERG
jgi:hypothetical protein